MTKHVDWPTDTTPFPDGARPGGWWRETENSDRLLCELCPRACLLRPGDRGFCFVRENRAGQMVLNTYGRSTGFCIDPIEKKPLNHFYPGTSVLSFGTAGCNLGCKFCQNWDISKSRQVERLSETAQPQTIARAAKQLGCHSVAFTYNDPVIWAEYAIDTARECRALGIHPVAVTAGYITPKARGAFYSAMDAANVDLKGFSERFYFDLTAAHIEPVLDTLRYLRHETDVWFEITNLIIPAENDDPSELRSMCDWILENVGDQVPVHFSAFHPDFRMMDHPHTPPETLAKAHEIARSTGLKYAYVGNVHDSWRQSTYCHGCGELLIERDWYRLGAYQLRGNKCGHCGITVPGHFDQQPGDWGQRRQVVRISDFAEPPGGQPITARSSQEPAMGSQPNPVPSAAGSAPSRGVSIDGAAERIVHDHAWEIVASHLLRRPFHPRDAEFASLATLPVMGAFVTLKRRGRLRACCGALGPSLTLSSALDQAARRAASEDPRLPPISPSELPCLTMDVTLLDDLEPMASDSHGRLQGVVIGRHGLRIERDGRAGLLLPQVPVEHGWDVQQFLAQVCVKAGLPSDAWTDARSKLERFSGRVIEGPTPVDEFHRAIAELPPRFDASQHQRLLEHCRRNLMAILRGATPDYYASDCPDGDVHGIVLTIVRPEPRMTGHVVQLSLRPPLPLQSTLFRMLEEAAALIQHRGWRGTLSIELSLLDDPAMHGTLDEPDPRGFDPLRRCSVVCVHDQQAMLRLPEQDVEHHLELLRTLTSRSATKPLPLYSFRIQNADRPLEVNTFPAARPIASGGSDGSSKPSDSRDSMAARPSAVAGMFYPAGEGPMRSELNRLFQPWTEPLLSARAVMLPHAGWRYSGAIAADVLRRIERPTTVIVLGPKHTALGVEYAVAPCERWELPGGAIESDVELARELAGAVDNWRLDDAAHAREHAVEVELPMLRHVAPGVRVVGVALGRAEWGACERFGEQLAGVLRGLERPPLLVISSDMNHFADDATTRRLDRLALEALESLDGERLLATVREHQISMCGVVPAVVVLEALRQLGGPLRAEQVAYGTSGDVTGDTSRVVGYAGLILA